MEKKIDYLNPRLKDVLEHYKEDRKKHIADTINKEAKENNARKLIGEVFNGKIIGADNPFSFRKDEFGRFEDHCIFLDIGMDFPVHLPVEKISDEIMINVNPDTEIQVIITGFISKSDKCCLLATTDINYQKSKVRSEVSNSNNELERKNISQIIKAKNSDIFIFDTNSIIDYYEYFNVFIETENKQIIIPYIVLEELDNLKRDEKIGKKVRNGLKKIYEIKDKIKFEESYPEKLLLGFDKRKNDNLILSVAIQNKGAVIVTEDTGLLIKAFSLNIAVCVF
jgi:rRNA-processing protein FCF1